MSVFIDNALQVFIFMADKNGIALFCIIFWYCIGIMVLPLAVIMPTLLSSPLSSDISTNTELAKAMLVNNKQLNNKNFNITN